MKVLFVCLGNICRSPTAEGVFRQYVRNARLDSMITIDSAGTGDWHVGKPPDERACRAAASRGYDLRGLTARQVGDDDYRHFDLILAMDEDNLRTLKALQPPNGKAELDLFLRRFNLTEEAVPDPYYGGEDGFDHVLDLVEQGAGALLDELRGRL